MKLFIKKSIFFIVSLVILIVSFNIIVDPANIFFGIEQKIAKYLTEGYNVTGNYNINERSLQKQLIQKLKTSPSTVILGSSRIMQVGKHFYGDDTINNGVSGASLEDLIAIYQMYFQRGYLAKKIVIGIDPWIFNENSSQDRWETLRSEYYSFFDEEIPFFRMPSITNYAQLLSLSYFQESFKMFPQILKTKKIEIKPTTNDVNETFTRLADGTITYDLKYREVTNQEVENKARNEISGDLYSLEKYNRLSEKALSEFDRFIETIKNKNISIEFILMPYHPLVYDYIKSNQKYNIVMDVEAYIRKYSIENDIPIIGSYDPEVLRLESSDFYDGMHLTPEGINKVIIGR